MKPLIIILLVFGLQVRAEEDEAKKLQVDFNLNWSTISVSPSKLLTDYATHGPYLIIQQLPDNRVLLSTLESIRHSPTTPKAVRFVEDGDELETILEDIVKLFTKSNPIERKVSGGPIYSKPMTTIEIAIRNVYGVKRHTRILLSDSVLTTFIQQTLYPE